jgi:hypothetical protein
MFFSPQVTNNFAASGESRTHIKNPSAPDMSQFRHNQEATTKVYRLVKQGGVTQSVSKLAISQRVAAVLPRRFVASSEM